jgi:hypothetical protein
MIPHIRQADGQTGFYWVTANGRPVSLPELVVADDEPRRLVPTHLSALDDALIEAAGRWGEVLGGGRRALDEDERTQLTELHRVLDRLNYEYAEAVRLTGLGTEIRAGQIVGTSALLAIRARMALDSVGPTPFDGMLDEPRPGVLAGHGQFHYVDREQPWRGGRWILAAQDGRRYPLTLSMLLHGSGVEKDAAVQEHREALRGVVGAVGAVGADPAVAAAAVDWLLHDWLMAHRESEDSAAIEIRPGHADDAALIVAAADAAARSRARTDPAVFAVAASGLPRGCVQPLQGPRGHARPEIARHHGTGQLRGQEAGHDGGGAGEFVGVSVGGCDDKAWHSRVGGGGQARRRVLDGYRLGGVEPQPATGQAVGLRVRFQPRDVVAGDDDGKTDVGEQPGQQGRNPRPGPGRGHPDQDAPVLQVPQQGVRSRTGPHPAAADPGQEVPRLDLMQSGGQVPGFLFLVAALDEVPGQAPAAARYTQQPAVLGDVPLVGQVMVPERHVECRPVPVPFGFRQRAVDIEDHGA